MGGRGVPGRSAVRRVCGAGELDGADQTDAVVGFVRGDDARRIELKQKPAERGGVETAQIRAEFRDRRARRKVV